MDNDRSLLEREMKRPEIRPFTLEGFHRLRERWQRKRWIRAGVVALLVVAMGACGPSPEPTTPPPSGLVLRANGEVLSFTGDAFEQAPGDLVAVTPGTGEQRVLAKDLNDVSNARWSADGRWVAFETQATLWVVNGQLRPRKVFETPSTETQTTSWTWSSSGARLAIVRGSTLFVIEASTGLVTELASTVGDVTSAPAWSPDGTTIVFGARGGSVYSVDVGTGERSLVVRLPGEHLDSIDGIAWSPDGSRLAVYNDVFLGSGLLIIMDPDGSDIGVLAENLVFGLDWSPDGSRIAFTEDYYTEVRVFVAPADGSTASLLAWLHEPYNPVWSPDGMRIALGRQNAFRPGDAPESLVIAADGSGEAMPLDDLTYESWRGGSYDCDCHPGQ